MAIWTHLHGGCNTHDPIFFRTAKLTTILIKPVNQLWRLVQDKIILMDKCVTNLYSTKCSIRHTKYQCRTKKKDFIQKKRTTSAEGERFPAGACCTVEAIAIAVQSAKANQNNQFNTTNTKK